MPRELQMPPPGFADLSIDDKLEYVQALWDHVTARPEDVPVPAWHREIIEARMESHRLDPTAALPAAQVRDEVEEKLEQHSLRRRS